MQGSSITNPGPLDAGMDVSLGSEMMVGEEHSAFEGERGIGMPADYSQQNLHVQTLDSEEIKELEGVNDL